MSSKEKKLIYWTATITLYVVIFILSIYIIRYHFNEKEESIVSIIFKSSMMSAFIILLPATIAYRFFIGKVLIDSFFDMVSLFFCTFTFGIIFTLHLDITGYMKNGSGLNFIYGLVIAIIITRFLYMLIFKKNT